MHLLATIHSHALWHNERMPCTPLAAVQLQLLYTCCLQRMSRSHGTQLISTVGGCWEQAGRQAWRQAVRGKDTGMHMLMLGYCPGTVTTSWPPHNCILYSGALAGWLCKSGRVWRNDLSRSSDRTVEGIDWSYSTVHGNSHTAAGRYGKYTSRGQLGV